jgi:hypothetical protein
VFKYWDFFDLVSREYIENNFVFNNVANSLHAIDLFRVGVFAILELGN